MKISNFIRLKSDTRISFKGKEFCIPWDVNAYPIKNIPLCTKKQFMNFHTSYGHLYWRKGVKRYESEIRRYGEKIGTISDIKLIKENKGVIISKESFLAYEKVRRSGKVNMNLIAMVCQRSNWKLNYSTCKEIMKNYTKLRKKYIKE